VSIVMRTKDRPRFLERALGSVLAQTLGDFELVVVNDGGDAATVDDLVARAADARIRVLHNAGSAGMVAASNRVIRESRAPFVAVHDDDDTWHPTFLERTVRHADELEAMGVVATTDHVVERVDGDAIVELERTRLFPGVSDVSLYRLCFENYATPIAFLYRRVAFESIGEYDERFGGAADWEFALRFAQRYEIEFLATDEALACYHHRADATGIELNSVYTEAHRRAERRIANELMRGDVARGALGIGYVVNELRHRADADERLFDRQKEALDERVEYLASTVWKVDRRVEALERSLAPGARLRAWGRFTLGLPLRLLRRPD
jgi:glycosyltransferase involved in cell wall biosynthesis